MKWESGVECTWLLNMMWVPHFSCNTIKIVCVCQLLTLVHDGCLWLGGPILIIDMLIHQIMLFLYQGVDPADAFVGKSQENKLAYQMKCDFRMVKKLHYHVISSISDGMVKFTTQILAKKIMRIVTMMKCWCQ